jgi:Rieske Fe-S protein
VVAGGGILTACGGDEEPSTASAGTTPDSGETAPGGGDVLAATSDIPVGGGTIFPDAQVVVTQPSQGEFKVFTAVCTHAGCTVASVSGGTINCDCHGSQFDIETGEPVGGPAPSPLAEQSFSVQRQEILLG